MQMFTKKFCVRIYEINVYGYFNCFGSVEVFPIIFVHACIMRSQYLFVQVLADKVISVERLKEGEGLEHIWPYRSLSLSLFSHSLSVYFLTIPPTFLSLHVW